MEQESEYSKKTKKNKAQLFTIDMTIASMFLLSFSLGMFWLMAHAFDLQTENRAQEETQFIGRMLTNELLEETTLEPGLVYQGKLESTSLTRVRRNLGIEPYDIEYEIRGINGSLLVNTRSTEPPLTTLGATIYNSVEDNLSSRGWFHQQNIEKFDKNSVKQIWEDQNGWDKLTYEYAFEILDKDDALLFKTGSFPPEDTVTYNYEKAISVNMTGIGLVAGKIRFKLWKITRNLDIYSSIRPMIFLWENGSQTDAILYIKVWKKHA